MIRKILTIVLLAVGLQIQAQSVSQIKADESYIYGEGWGTTLKQADQSALQDLTSKISVTVNASSFMDMEEISKGGKIDAKRKFENLINTYSQATLTNTQRILIKNEPDAQVLRYIKVSEVDRIFDGRKAKVLDMVESAIRAEKKAKIDDALRYYYWSFELLKSLQHANEVQLVCPDGKRRLLITWIPEQINEIFSNIRVATLSQTGDEVEIQVTYKDRPVNSFDYTYFDGMDWSNIYSAKDGHGVIDLRPGQIAENLRIKCEYQFAGEAHIDREIEGVMNIVDDTPFRGAYINVKGHPRHVQHETFTITQQNAATAIASTDNYDDYLSILNVISKGIQQKNYASILKYFTIRGDEQFQKLINYGRAQFIGNTDVQFSRLGDKVICRGLTMSFRFRNNNRKFVENIVLIFDKQKRIDEVKFGLGKEAYNDIMLKGAWSQDARIILANFMEDYQTAYALKDIDFVRNVFDDNAVIITGRVTNRPRNAMERSQYIDSKIIKYNRQTKNEYLRNLAHCFAGNEYINIRFADNDIIKAGKGGETYGIQIRQDYYSSTYGDTGYLFLMVDVNNPDNPVIKVRTWQPEKDPDFGVYGLSDFF
ncbi:LPP20 family lipoprotein [Prevotella sp. P6B1]|uniref:LPP20 family lipoprotein n=1 Tax=Prevotella sp. P6B1 TaxID=1410613 RepID=UPI0006896EBB|nr:LPP20 family lipoprotein [Prevotella sp. P6B1]